MWSLWELAMMETLICCIHSPPLKKQQIFTDIPQMITERQERNQLFDERSMRKRCLVVC